MGYLSQFCGIGQPFTENSGSKPMSSHKVHKFVKLRLHEQKNKRSPGFIKFLFSSSSYPMTSSAPITFINETTQSVANTVSPNTVAAPTTAMKPSTATTELSTSPAPSSSPASPSPSTVTINNNSSNNINESNCNSNGPASFPEKGRWTEAREIQFLKSYSETAPFAAGYGFTNAAWNKVLKEVNAVDREEPSLTYGSLRRKITSLYKKYIPSGAVLGTLPVLDKPNPTFEQLVVRVWYTVSSTISLYITTAHRV